MAWLHATPKPDPRSKRAKAEHQPAPISRLDQFRRKKAVVAMPPNPMPHIITRLVEIGLTESNGMAATPLSWREIDAWCARTGIDLSPWEARLMRSLSVAYLNEKAKAESETCPPPWRTEVTQREIDADEAALDAVLG
jgi:hypothetical protein